MAACQGSCHDLVLVAATKEGGSDLAAELPLKEQARTRAREKAEAWVLNPWKSFSPGNQPGRVIKCY